MGPFKLFKLCLGLMTVGIVIALGVAYSAPYWFARKTVATVDIGDAALIERGRYLARAGDCMGCHTAPGGKDFAGGLAMRTPMGTLYSTNITPDKATGIGTYRYGDFERAVRQGFRPDGTPLYPAMPFVSYAIIRDDDVKALYAYFMARVAPVTQSNAASTIPWPLSMRWPLVWWQFAFAGHRSFEPSATASAPEARGAYLVEGLTHCGACHTPRGIGFQEKALGDSASGDYLSGATLEGWFASNLRGEAGGLSSWTKDEIVDLLKTGRTARSAAFGSMVYAVEHSTRYLTDDDLVAIAGYLKTLGPRPRQPTRGNAVADTTTAKLRAGDYDRPGAVAYAENCASCHRADGRGVPRIFPALSGNPIQCAQDPSSLIQITLAGSAMARSPGDRMAFVMPGFAQLSNQTVADLLTFVCHGWGNQGPVVTADAVGAMRASLVHKPQNFVPGGVP